MKLIYTSLVIGMSFALTACEGKKRSASNAKAVSTSTDADVTYTSYVKGWLDDNCTSCHSPDGSSPDLTTYALAKKHGEHILASIQDEENPMPEGGPLPPDDEVAKIEAWIEAGMPKGKAGSGASALVTWDGWVGKWIADECASCHKADDSTPPALTTFEEVKQNIDAVLASIQDEDAPMPPDALPGVDVVAKMKAWKDAGMPKSAPSGGGSDGASGGGGGGVSTATGSSAATGTGGGAAAEVTYEGFMRGWIQQKCVSCHKQGGTAEPDLSTYDDTKDNIDAILASIQDAENPMPPAGGLPGADIVAKVNAWKDSGMPRGGATTATSTGASTSTSTRTSTSTSTGKTTSTATGTQTSTGTATAAVTYEGSVRAYLNQRCTSCHKPGDTAPDLTTFAVAKAAAPRVLARVNGKDPKGLMPPNGQTAAANILTMLEGWIAGGTKER